jgi:phosphate transport system permease protein
MNTIKTKKSFYDLFLKSAIYLSATITVAVLVIILGYIIINGLGGFSVKFVAELTPMIVSTLYLVFLGILISTPIGICAAVYLVEYAKAGRTVRFIRFATECLSGIPSIIFGLFGMLFFVQLLKLKFSIVSGALTVSMMVLPTIIRTTEEALKAVPKSYREGSLGLGASKIRTIAKVIVPTALPGILTSVILSIGRIVGETAALIFTAGTVAKMPKGLMSSGRTLSVHLYLLAKEAISFQKAYATATILVIIVFVLNFIASKLAKSLNKSNS